MWLKNNHDKVGEIWLIFHKKHTGIPSVSYEDAVEEALCFGWIDSIKKKIDEKRYKQKFTPRRRNSKWSELNKKRVKKLISQNLMTKAGLEVIRQAKTNGTWDLLPAARLPIEMPKEFKGALNRNHEAGNFFNSLAPSFKKQYIGWVGSAKKAETRQRRIGKSIELLEKGEKLGMK